MVQPTKLSWKFPVKEFFLLRLEILFVVILAILIFVFSFFSLEQTWTLAILFTAIFLGLYFLISFVVQKTRAARNEYQLTPKHLDIIKKIRDITNRERVHLKDIKHHKLDKLFLGGYLLTHKGKRHVLFFNTKAEVEKFESFIKKHLKKK
ncbi:hypothetical protein HZC32_03600 [Candidatus Woesearchaeota archaeon]|nr:hypothetical protein [Candidatus Woesearchaeota archaeon]